MIPLESCSPSSVHRGPRQQQITEEKRRQRHARWERGGVARGSSPTFKRLGKSQIVSPSPSPDPGTLRFVSHKLGRSQEDGAAELSQLGPLIGPPPNLVDSRCSLAARLNPSRSIFENQNRDIKPSLHHHDILHNSITRRLSHRKISPSQPHATASMAAEQRKLLGTVPPFSTPRPP